MVAPAAAHQHKILAVQVADLQMVLLCQRMVQCHGAADGYHCKLCARTLAQVEQRIVKNAAHHVNVLAEVFQDFACILRRIENGTSWNLMSAHSC